jgi:ribonuclease P protein component
MRFRPEQHLRRQNDIRAVRELGSRSDWRLFTLWCYQRPIDSAVGTHSRTAVVASIAAIGAAVERNRAKRRLREVFRKHQEAIPAGYDLLLIARTAIKKCSLVELEQRFLSAVKWIKPSAAPAPVAGSASASGTTSATS